MSEHDRGQVDTSAAEIYDELFVPAPFGRFAEPVADHAEPGPDEPVVDLACGTGALTRQLRRRTAGRVVGIDVNPAMIAVAERQGGEIDYRVGDATGLTLADREFGLATCQFGLMFLPDPVRGVWEMARVAKRGVVAVWAPIEQSEGYRAMQELFRDELGDKAASSLDAPFAMGVEGTLETVLDEAGIGNASFELIEGTGRFDSIGHWVTTEVRGWTLGESISDQQLASLIGVAENRLGEFQTTDGCVFGMAAKTARWSS